MTEHEKSEQLRVIFHAAAARAIAKGKARKALQWIIAARHHSIMLAAFYDDICAADEREGFAPPIAAKNRLLLRNVLDDGAWYFATREEFDAFASLEHGALVAQYGLADARSSALRAVLEGGLNIAGLHLGTED